MTCAIRFNGFRPQRNPCSPPCRFIICKLKGERERERERDRTSERERERKREREGGREGRREGRREGGRERESAHRHPQTGRWKWYSEYST